MTTLIIIMFVLAMVPQVEVRPNGVTAFVQVQAGEFAMASETGNDDEKPIHRVRISQRFEIGKYEITQREWQMLMGRNPSLFKGAERPVENVTWEECQQFIARLNQRGDGYRYRLPTEAKWEYACRAEQARRSFPPRR